MKILLLGKNGQLGWELQRSLATLGELIALDRHSTHLCGDLENTEGLRSTIRQVRPDVIVNAGAYTAVDKAESETERSYQVNARASQTMAEEAALLGSWLVHYSTDYVFEGGGSTAWSETDPVAPLNVYGASKSEGEQAIVSSGCKHLIFRTSWVYGALGNNFAKTMLRLAQEREHGADAHRMSQREGAFFADPQSPGAREGVDAPLQHVQPGRGRGRRRPRLGIPDQDREQYQRHHRRAPDLRLSPRHGAAQPRQAQFGIRFGF